MTSPTEEEIRAMQMRDERTREFLEEYFTRVPEGPIVGTSRGLSHPSSWHCTIGECGAAFKTTYDQYDELLRHLSERHEVQLPPDLR